MLCEHSGSRDVNVDSLSHNEHTSAHIARSGCPEQRLTRHPHEAKLWWNCSEVAAWLYLLKTHPLESLTSASVLLAVGFSRQPLKSLNSQFANYHPNGEQVSWTSYWLLTHLHQYQEGKLRGIQGRAGCKSSPTNNLIFQVLPEKSGPQCSFSSCSAQLSTQLNDTIGADNRRLKRFGIGKLHQCRLL